MRGENGGLGDWRKRAPVTYPVVLRTAGADVLSDEQRALVNAERALLADLRSALDVVGDRFHTQAEPPAHAVG